MGILLKCTIYFTTVVTVGCREGVGGWGGGGGEIQNILMFGGGRGDWTNLHAGWGIVSCVGGGGGGGRINLLCQLW